MVWGRGGACRVPRVSPQHVGAGQPGLGLCCEGAGAGCHEAWQFAAGVPRLRCRAGGGCGVEAARAFASAGVGAMGWSWGSRGSELLRHGVVRERKRLIQMRMQCVNASETTRRGGV